MNDELQRIFDSAPEDPPRSRLEPYRELILQWRCQRRTYRRICELLLEKCNVHISYFPLYEFVQSRSRPRQEEPAPPPPSAPDRWAPERERMRLHKEQSPTTPPPTPKIFEYTDEDASRPLYTEPVQRKSREELLAQRDAVRAAYEKPIIPPPAEPKKRFVYDPDKPPVNKNYENG